MKKIMIMPTLAILMGMITFDKNSAFTPVNALTPMPTQVDLSINNDAEVSAYYAGVEGKKGDTLLSTLYSIIKDHNEYSYVNNTHRTIFKIIDREWNLGAVDGENAAYFENYNYAADNGYMRKLYADYNDSITTADRFYVDGSTTAVTFDKEHIWPQSFGGFGRNTGAGSDFHALWASDSAINSNAHNNNHFGEPTMNIVERLNDKGSLGGYTGKMEGAPDTIFEPLDQFKGDVARAMFYMPARYYQYESPTKPKLELVNGTPAAVTADINTTGKAGDLKTLLEWNELDPVDEYEIRRNNLIANNFQGNRNPFIDYPQWARIAYDPSYVSNGASNASETSSVGTLGDEFSSATLLSLTLDVANVKQQYFKNESFTSANLVLIGHYSNQQSRLIRNFTSSITNGTPLTNDGSFEVIISASHNDQTLTAAYQISVDTQTLNQSLILSEVYGGGGNANASYNYDFVELYNNSEFDINLRGKSIQYASATSAQWNQTTLNGFIQSKSFFLVRMATSNINSGVAIPLEDQAGTTSMAAGSLKVALVNSTTKLTVLDPTNDPIVIDFLGTGDANASFGEKKPALSGNINSYQRKFSINGPAMMRDNKTDYEVVFPTPFNSALSIAEQLDTLNEGGLQCLVYYPLYKQKIRNLSMTKYDEDTGVVLNKGQKEYFLTSTEGHLLSARSRYEAWAIYLGDQDPYSQFEPLSIRERENITNQSLTPIMFLGAFLMIAYLTLSKKQRYYI